ncbi:uncharacterized protein LOC108025715 [Drosophila biarmipes]|uniref:uncharacterized protein LOC108025715 n=1 Tax=Drosophila biarmipes TaxID=125945 RepID=UPI0007E68584|nr:uncharacterized protein LOC108025715 [Drosophila biarmipes]
MADGFKRYFNGTTINGRANVAKATYATLALLFIFYRMRRGSKSSSELASGKCSCESDQDPSVSSDIGVYGVDPDCSVCRERSERAMTEYDREQQRRAAGEDEGGCRDDPPPPPPPPASGGAGSAPRRKCPCEEPQRRAEGAVKTSSHSTSSSSRVRNQQLQPPYQYQQYKQTEAEQVRPASQVMGQVHDAFYRVLRGVVGAVLGNAAVNTSGAGSATEASAQAAGAGISSDGLEDDERYDDQDYETSDESPLKRRNAPRSCVPTSGGRESASGQPEEQSREQAGAQSEEQAEYNAFSDGFASGLYFTSDEM